MTIKELKNELDKLNDKHDDFEIRFRTLVGHHNYIIDNIFKEIDYKYGKIYLEGYETPYKD